MKTAPNAKAGGSGQAIRWYRDYLTAGTSETFSFPEAIWAS
jgi:hypothetical protein